MTALESAIEAMQRASQGSAAIYRQHIETLVAAARAGSIFQEKATQLQAFKDFVHTTLDDAGVDKHEELNATSGCRVGGRLKDLITTSRDNARLVDETHRWSEAVKKLEAERAAPAGLLCLAGDLEDAIGKWGQALIKLVDEAETVYEYDYAGGSDAYLKANVVTSTIARECNNLIDNLRKLDAATRRSTEHPAVKEMHELREQDNRSKSPLRGIAGAAYSWRDAKNDPPTEFDPEDEFFTRKFIICIDGKVSTDAGYFTKSGRWIIAGRHGDPVNVTHYRDYPADPA